jgi:hypothetical protein
MRVLRVSIVGVVLIASILLTGCPTGCFLCSSPPPIFDPAPQLSAYIRSLPELPYKSDTGTGTETLLSSGIPEISVADPNPNALYPGSVVQGNTDFENSGKLSNYFLDPGDGVITITNVHFASPTATSQQHIAPATIGNVSDAISRLTHQPFQPSQTGIAYSDISTVYSAHAAKQTVSATFSGYGADASAFFLHADTKTENHIVFYFTQSYYAISYQPDSDTHAGPSAFFAEGTTVDDAKTANMTASNPPIFVSTVTYGRRLYVMLSSQNSSDQMRASVQAAIHSLTASGGGQGTAATDDILNTSHMQVLAIGGRASATNPILATFSAADIAPALTAYIRNGLDYSGAGGPQDAGLPISYSLSYLQDMAPAKLDSVTHYDPSSASGPVVTQLDVILTIGSDDKEREDGITLGIRGPQQWVAIDSWVPAHTSDQNLYWDQGTHHSTTINLSTPIPADQLHEYYFNVHSEGPDSWRANFAVYARGTMMDPRNPPNRIPFGPVPVLSEDCDCLFLDQDLKDHGDFLKNPPI